MEKYYDIHGIQVIESGCRHICSELGWPNDADIGQIVESLNDLFAFEVRKHIHNTMTPFG